MNSSCVISRREPSVNCVNPEARVAISNVPINNFPLYSENLQRYCVDAAPKPSSLIVSIFPDLSILYSPAGFLKSLYKGSKFPEFPICARSNIGSL